MWIFTQGGLLSAVQHTSDKDLVFVRARRRAHLLYHFPLHQPLYTPHGDYHWRIVVSKQQFASVVAEAAMQINYPNFKDSVSDDLYHVYTNVWVAAQQLSVFMGDPNGNE